MTRLESWLTKLKDRSPSERAEALALLAQEDPTLAEELQRVSGGATQAEHAIGAAISGEVPKRIGEYQIRSVLGRGGMGVVYLAERPMAGTVQRVALKVLGDALLSPRALNHFFIERRILASLNHPNIATLIEAGAADDGTPFLAMEYVDGQTLDEYCAGRSERERIDLLQGVLDAVAFAHRNLVVHRDLKPSNILVTASGVPKLLDFGIAKLLDDTGPQATQSRLYTPDYASPEQLAGEPVTTASDIYALGIVFHEVLAGNRPTRQGRERGVSSALRPGLRRIVEKMLQAEPAQRYHSVAAVADDLAAHLTGQPLVHASETASERALKFARRHRVGVTLAAASLIAGALLLGLSLYGAARLAAERDRALAAERSSQQVVEFLVNVFEQADPDTSEGREITARDVLDTSVRSVDALASTDLAAQAQLYRALGRIHDNLGMNAQALTLGQKALDAYRQLQPPQLSAQLSQMRHVMMRRNAAGDLAGADALLVEMGELIERHTLPPRERALLSLARSNLYEQRGDSAAAVREADAALAQFRAIGETDSIDYADALSNRGEQMIAAGDPRGALPLLQISIDIRKRESGENHSRTIHALMQHGRALREAGEVQASLAQHEDILARRMRLLGPMHPDVALSANEIANVYHDLGDVPNAERYYRQALAILRNEATFDGRSLAQTSNNLAILLEQAGRFDAAAELYRESIALRRKYAGDDTLVLVRAEHNYGVFLGKLGRFDEALKLLERAVKARDTALGADHLDTLLAKTNLAFTRFLADPGAENGAQSRVAFSTLIEHLGDQPAMRQMYELRLAQLLLALGESAQAADIARTVRDANSDTSSVNHAVAELTLGVALVQSGDESGRALIARARGVAEPTLAPTSPLRAALREVLGEPAARP